MSELDKPREQCGIIGIHSPDSSFQVSRFVFDGLMALQHRGQESAGIYTHAGRRINGYKNMGLVHEVFTERILTGIFGHIAIGHVRYSTTSTSTLDNAQPFHFQSPLRGNSFAIAFNGTLTNFIQLQKKYRERGHVFYTSTDTEVIAHIIASKLNEHDQDWIEALKDTMSILDGSYSLTILNENDELYGIRDPLGFKPLCFGHVKDPNLTVIASESVAIDSLDGKLERSIKPGEIVKIDKSGIYFEQAVTSENQAFCMFEFVYFSRPDSIIDGVSVYDVREQLGEYLAKNDDLNADVVVPIPDSGRTAAAGYSAASGIPLREGLMKNRYVHRTFIMPAQGFRERSVRLKLNPVLSQVKGKNVVLIDDTIVRATTARRIVRMLREAGANKVHLRISCPPIVSSCYMGIDFPTRRELVASTKTVEEIAKFIGVDSLKYQSIEDLVKCCKLPRNKLCLACLNGKYPVKTPIDFDMLENELGKSRV
ncbi:MAG: amidophosphoribosyltransferase [Candidatus Helarchaeota archaeon]